MLGENAIALTEPATGGDVAPAFSDPSLRGWQRRALAAAAGWRAGPFLIAAAPGAGKTRPAVVLARELLRRREIDRVAIVCPTAPLTQQWASAAATAGLSLQPARDHRGLPGDRGHLCAGRFLGGGLCTRMHAADARDRRRGPPPR